MDYLLGHDFSLVTDHAPLKWMATAKDTNARVTRWFLALQDYRFKVVHRPGRANVNGSGEGEVLPVQHSRAEPLVTPAIRGIASTWEGET